MHIQTHIMAGWCSANLLPGLNKRERLFAMIAAVVPDVDGLSILGGRDAYWNWHHRAGHNLGFCIVACLVLAVFSSSKVKSFLLYVAQFHLHLLMDVLGSGPGWGIYYFWPFSGRYLDNSNVSWEFYSWQNITIAATLFVGVLGIVFWKGRTPLEAIMPRLDRQLVGWITRRVAA